MNPRSIEYQHAAPTLRDDGLYRAEVRYWHTYTAHVVQEGVPPRVRAGVWEAVGISRDTVTDGIELWANANGATLKGAATEVPSM